MRGTPEASESQGEIRTCLKFGLTPKASLIGLDKLMREVYETSVNGFNFFVSSLL